jgi:predicted HTH transcriptional regulator
LKFAHKIENTYFIELKNKQTLEAIKEDKKNEILKIKNGENNLVEFKSTLRWDINKGQINKTMEFMVIKAISAFLNSQGGTLYIGLSDDGTIIGLEKDYSTFKKKNRDGFLLYFNDLLIKYFSKTIFTYIEHNIEEESGKDYAIIKIKKSPKPIFITENKEKLFFIRFSASVQKLEIDEAVTYILSNWK